MARGKWGCQFPNCHEPPAGVLLVWSQIFTDEVYANGRKKQKTRASKSVTLCDKHLNSSFEEAILTLPNNELRETRPRKQKKSKGKKKDAQKKREKREGKA